jgi:hypothetical protein
LTGESKYDVKKILENAALAALSIFGTDLERIKKFKHVAHPVLIRTYPVALLSTYLTVLLEYIFFLKISNLPFYRLW